MNFTEMQKTYKLDASLITFVKNHKDFSFHRDGHNLIVDNTDAELKSIIGDAKVDRQLFRLIHVSECKLNKRDFALFAKLNSIKIYRVNNHLFLTLADYQKYFKKEDSILSSEIMVKSSPSQEVAIVKSKETKEVETALNNKSAVKETEVNSHVSCFGKVYDLNKVQYNGCKLYAHQLEMLKLMMERIDLIYNKDKNVFHKLNFQAATGSGKTIVELLPAYILNVPLLVITPSEKIVDDMITTCYNLSTKVKVSKLVRNKIDLTAQIIVTTYQTLARRLNKPSFADLVQKIEANKGYVVCDESHHAICVSISSALKRFEIAPIIGFTATPIRRTINKSTHLSSFWNDVDTDGGKPAMTISIGDCVKSGVLAKPTLIFRTDEMKDLINDSELHVLFNEYTNLLRNLELCEGGSKRLAELITMIQEKQSELYTNSKFFNVAWNFLAKGNAGKTIGFCLNRQQAFTLAEYFNQAGWKAFYIDAGTPLDARNKCYKYFNEAPAGSKTIILNCAVLTEGADFPTCESILIAKLFDSIGSFIQAVGRGLRKTMTKNVCKIFDLTGNTENFYYYNTIKFGIMNVMDAKENTNKGLNPVKTTTVQSDLKPIYRTEIVRADLLKENVESVSLEYKEHKIDYNCITSYAVLRGKYTIIKYELEKDVLDMHISFGTDERYYVFVAGDRQVFKQKLSLSEKTFLTLSSHYNMYFIDKRSDAKKIVSAMSERQLFALSDMGEEHAYIPDNIFSRADHPSRNKLASTSLTGKLLEHITDATDTVGVVLNRFAVKTVLEKLSL